MKRRDFLKVTAGGAAAGVMLPRFSRAAPFGEFPASASGLLLPANVRATKVLELFLYGGMSPWETLYNIDGFGAGDNTWLNAFPTEVGQVLTACGGGTIGEDFGLDANGEMVQLGPFSQPIRGRADVKGRMRILVHRHDLEPHEAAIPLALSGKKIGNPTLAGLGAHISRYHVDRPEAGRTTPYGYLFVSDSIPGDNVNAAVATGLHTGDARPLRIRIDSAGTLLGLLNRDAIGNATQRAQYDAVIAAQVERYRNRLKYGGAGASLRSPKLSNLAIASNTVANADALQGILSAPGLFTPQNNAYCGSANQANYPRMGLELAVHLLTHATEPARYACVVDSGLETADGGGGYDEHFFNCTERMAINFTNVMTHLLSLINGPAENDPNKLYLDDTLIIINTEFGRTPWSQDGTGGRNHHPYGYVTAFIGGPITAGQSGVVGAIAENGYADSYVLASESRMGALLAMGIWPFSQEAFGVSDVQGVTTEEEAVESVTERVLGYTL